MANWSMSELWDEWVIALQAEYNGAEKTDVNGREFLYVIKKFQFSDYVQQSQDCSISSNIAFFIVYETYVLYSQLLEYE